MRPLAVADRRLRSLMLLACLLLSAAAAGEAGRDAAPGAAVPRATAVPSSGTAGQRRGRPGVVLPLSHASVNVAATPRGLAGESPSSLSQLLEPLLERLRPVVRACATLASSGLERARSTASAKLASLSPDARWLLLGSVLVLGVNVIAMLSGCAQPSTSPSP